MYLYFSGRVAGVVNDVAEIGDASGNIASIFSGWKSPRIKHYVLKLSNFIFSHWIYKNFVIVLCKDPKKIFYLLFLFFYFCLKNYKTFVRGIFIYLFFNFF